MNSSYTQNTRFTRAKVRRSRAAGMTIVELLLALSICALMLAAVGVAFDAALKSYSANQDRALAGRSARNVLNMMAGTLRSAWNDPCTSPITVSVDGDECSFVDAEGRSVVYTYDTDESQLQMSIDGGANTYVLMDGVSPVAEGEPIFTAWDPDDPVFPAGVVGQIDVRFQVQHGDTIYPVATAIVPRNILYH